jgi:hypothetical protein
MSVPAGLIEGHGFMHCLGQEAQVLAQLPHSCVASAYGSERRNGLALFECGAQDQYYLRVWPWVG